MLLARSAAMQSRWAMLRAVWSLLFPAVSLTWALPQSGQGPLHPRWRCWTSLPLVSDWLANQRSPPVISQPHQAQLLATVWSWILWRSANHSAHSTRCAWRHPEMSCGSEIRHICKSLCWNVCFTAAPTTGPVFAVQQVYKRTDPSYLVAFALHLH